MPAEIANMDATDHQSETSRSEASNKMPPNVENTELGKTETHRSSPRSYFDTLNDGLSLQEGEAQLKGVGWIRATLFMMKTQIGIGALGIPGIYITLDMIPGTLVLISVAIMTTWSNYQIGQFKLAHPDVYNLEGAMRKIFGRFAGYGTSVVLNLYYVFTAASAVVSISTCFNAISSHGTCTAVFIAIGSVAAGSLASIKTLNKVTWLSPIGLVFILVAIFMTVIAVGIQDHPHNYKDSAPWVSDWALFGNPSFPDAMAAVSSVIFSFSGTPYFFNIMSEMEEPKHYTRAMLCCQSVVFTTYFCVGVVVYYFCGSYTSSPALGSTTELMMKIGYGIALPGLLVTGMIVHHMPSKDIWLMMLRSESRRHHIVKKTKEHYIYWYSSVAGVTLVAYIIASAIPEFKALISLIGALFGTLIVLPPYGAMYLYRYSDKGRAAAAESQQIEVADLPPKPSTAVYRLGATWAVFIIIVGIYCTITGTWGAVQGIMTAYESSTGGSAAWSCANNA